MLDTLSLERHLQRLWCGRPEVYAVHVRPHAGQWAIVASGPGEAAPLLIPPVVLVDIGERRPVPVRVFWRRVPAASPRQMPDSSGPAAKPANDAMWSGASLVTKRPVSMIEPQPTAGVGTMTKVPTARLDAYQFFLPARTPELPFFSKPFNLRACICCQELELSRQVTSFATGSDQQLILQGISYDSINVPVGNQVRFRVRVSGQTVAEWTDVVASTTTGPANQFALSGHLNPMPLNKTVDHDQVLTVEAELLGVYPFTSPPPYASNAQICILLQGVISTMNDTREGTPRPIDLGDLNDVAQGFKDIVGEMRDGSMTDAVLAVLAQGAYEVANPASPQLGRR